MMAKTTDAQRAYSRGYQAGKRVSAAIDTANRIVMEQLVERAERAERGLGYGKCAHCASWRREPGAEWGVCLPQTNATAATPFPWPWRSGIEGNENVVTNAVFGCIFFKSRPAPGQVAG